MAQASAHSEKSNCVLPMTFGRIETMTMYITDQIEHGTTTQGTGQEQGYSLAELSPEHVAVLGGVALKMLQAAELRLLAAETRTTQMFDDVRLLREMVGTHGWHEL